MRSRTTRTFWRLYAVLPPDVKRQAILAYRHWAENPRHPGLQFKQVHVTRSIWSARINLGWHALGIREADTVTWFWIGSHDDYERLIRG